jgi:glycosyltransferase involved in cell wall biosynthesis
MVNQHTKTLVFITTYPPRKCGIATFSQDLAAAIKKLAFSNFEVKVAAMENPVKRISRYPAEVRWKIRENVKRDYQIFAESLNKSKKDITLVIQHEYGIFGNNFGENLLELINTTKFPVITVFHTVLPDPPEEMKTVTQKIIDKSKYIVVMSKKSKKIILEKYKLKSDNKIKVIHHGIHPVVFRYPDMAKSKLSLDGKIVATTFGMLTKNKGIEYVIQALPPIVKKFPNFNYLVVGATHPNVKASEGEKYRNSLKTLVKKLNLQKNVKFVDKYLKLSEILEHLHATDIYIATSLDPNQSVSGTFSYALGTGRAVISTKFSQAISVINNKIGRLVTPGNSEEMEKALDDLLSNPEKLKKMHWRAYRKTRQMIWPNVAHEYLKLLGKTYLPPLKLNHLMKMVTKLGMLQFSNKKVPDKYSLYTVDDNARAILCFLDLYNLGYIDKKTTLTYCSRFLRVIEKSDSPEGFVNEIDGVNPPGAEARISEDAQGRVFWGLCSIISEKLFEGTSIKRRATRLYGELFPKIKEFKHLKSTSFALYGLTILPPTTKTVGAIFYMAEKLSMEYKKNVTKQWRWFENIFTYANGIIPAALLRADRILGTREYALIALNSLEFLCTKTFMGNVYMPIGQNGWYKKPNKRSLFDQQPEDPYHTALSLREAWKITRDKNYLKRLEKCFSWFLGNNIHGLPVYSPKNGGTHDGLTRSGLNPNHGAESLLSYFFVRLMLEKDMLEEKIRLKKYIYPQKESLYLLKVRS